MTFQKGNKLGKGRIKGSKNRRQSVLARAKKLGFDPLLYVLDVAADKKAPRSERMEAAKIALPYCHARLSSSHNTNDKSGKSHAEWIEEIARDIQQHDSEQGQDGKGSEKGVGVAGRGAPDETGAAPPQFGLVVGGRAS
jgi:hypothetical protein